MKSFFYILFFMVACNCTFAQNNTFPTENAIWNESIRDNYRIFGLLGDTTFNGTVYSKLYAFNDTILSNEYRGWYIGGFRNEGQKVFFKPAVWEHTDILFYDFGSEVGDTVWHKAFFYDGSYIQHCEECYSVVTAITTDENNRKIYNIQCSEPMEYWHNWWYEGIGSNRGLLFSLPVSPLSLNDSPSNFNLNCFKYNDTVKYLNNNYPCNKCFCQQINIEDVNIEKIDIFPNPTNSQLTIRNEELGILDINIFDLMGKIVLKEQITNEINIDISHLQSGIYFLKINNKITKIIKN